MLTFYVASSIAIAPSSVCSSPLALTVTKRSSPIAGFAPSPAVVVVAVSRADLQRMRDLHLEYVRAMQSVIAESAPNECVGLYCAQLLPLDAG